MSKNTNNALALLDASALIAAVLGEHGSRMVEDAIEHGAAMSSVNLSESLMKLQQYGYTPEELQAALEDMRIHIIDFNESQAFLASQMLPYIKSHNLSLGDRACLAVAIETGYTVFTSDKIWTTLPFDVSIRLFRK